MPNLIGAAEFTVDAVPLDPAELPLLLHPVTTSAATATLAMSGDIRDRQALVTRDRTFAP
jgi:hypothetical protein